MRMTNELFDNKGRPVQVGIGSLKPVSVTKELAATAAYTAEDVLSESETAGSAWVFTGIARADGGGGYITKAQAICERTAVTPRLSLYLFRSTPTSELKDNAANTALKHADLANYLGRIDFPAMEDLGGDSEATATPSTSGNLPLAFQCAEDADDLYGVLVTRDALTVTAEDEMAIILTVEQY
jgi:hypothetical protein